VLLVGGRKAGACRGSGQLEPRGYELSRVARLPLSIGARDFDLVLFSLPPAADAEVLQHCEHLGLLQGPAVMVLQHAPDADFAVRVLEAGADDCLAPPHNPREVVARVRALLRRRAQNAGRYGGRHCVFDGYELDVVRMQVRSPDGREVELTQTQVRLLRTLLARPGEVVSREHLLAQVLGEETASFDRAIDVHVHRLKKRLAEVSDTELISAYRGVGYRLDVVSVTQ
jgi:DNA-binding response OmpR family regulator